jgi:membrane-associated protease RseP (regulator of RpoE activity)
VPSSSGDLSAEHRLWNEEAVVASQRGPTSREWCISFLLLAATILTTSLAGFFYVFGTIGFLDSVRMAALKPELLLQGMKYSVPLVAILLAHEAGHFLACHHYSLRCTPPYFIPVPFPLTGTLGAFIKIKSPFRDKNALFDVGIAGPLLGFAVTLPILFYGLHLSRVVPREILSPGIPVFGEPAILRLIAAAVLGYDPSVHDLMAHPSVMAGWFGLLVTSLNLLPVWQLDGGHIAYAVFGPRVQKRITLISIGALLLSGLLHWPTPSYLVFGILLLILGYRQKFFHPSTLHEWRNLSPGRLCLAFVAFIILAACFIPVPVTFSL